MLLLERQLPVWAAVAAEHAVAGVEDPLTVGRAQEAFDADLCRPPAGESEIDKLRRELGV